MKPKKSFGQHFLTAEPIAERIANSLSYDLSQYQQLLEVGPGKGMLTKYLLPKTNFALTAVEADADMVNYLAIHYPNLKVLSADFLKVPLDTEFSGNFAVIGNFPYNISSQIVFKVIEHRAQVPEMVGMFQREMAERIVAPPGSKEYGIISVLSQAYYAGKYLFTVQAGAFNPPPKVQSGVIRLVRKPVQDLGCDAVLFKNIVKTTFGQRRKMLRNTLKGFTQNEAFLASTFCQLRPEQLSVQDFIDLTNQIQTIRTTAI